MTNGLGPVNQPGACVFHHQAIGRTRAIWATRPPLDHDAGDHAGDFLPLVLLTVWQQRAGEKRERI